MTTHFVQANIKENETVTTHQVVPQLDDPHTPWRGSAPEATATADYLKRHAPATDTFTVVQGTPDPAYRLYPLDRCVERPREENAPQGT